MTILQSIRAAFETCRHVAALHASGVTFAGPPSVAAEMAAECDTIAGDLPLVRDILCREALTRRAVCVEQSGMGWIWKFDDGSQLTANDFGVWVR